MDLATLAPNRKYPMPTKKWYVYTLEYPDGTVFYVGKGTGRRVHMHETNALWALRATESEKRGYYLDNDRNKTIHKIWELGQHIKKSILFETDDLAEALIYEWGLTYAVCNAEHLTNPKRYNPGAENVPFKPRGQGIYRVWPKDKSGKRQKKEDVTPIK